MKLSREQFDLLVALTAGEELTIESLEEVTSLGYVADGQITEAGLEALEPYRAKRAILMAAGFGSRMLPVSAHVPKPLVNVNGTRIIDTLIDSLMAIDIDEIYIVRGYLGYLFDRLREKYPNIKFIENPIYDKANNISSLLFAKDLLQNSYLLEADLMVSNPGIFDKYHWTSNFLGIKVDETDDWCFHMDGEYIDKWQRGGSDCYQEVGISYWASEDGVKMAAHVPQSFVEPDGVLAYWETPMLIDHKDDYKLMVRECHFEDVVEIDSFDELKAIDPSYENYKRK